MNCINSSQVAEKMHKKDQRTLSIDMKTLIINLGQLRTVGLITAISIVMSMLLTYLLTEQFVDGFNLVGAIISILVPLFVAPVASWFLVGLIFKIHQLETKQRELATYDQLTGVMTRRAFFEHAQIL